MGSTIFKRGLDCQFVSRLNALYEVKSLWRELVARNDTFVAIRDNYVNVYHSGAEPVNDIETPLFMI